MNYAAALAAGTLAQIGEPARPTILDLFAHFGAVAWTVAAVLMALSIGSWSVMFGKYLQLRRAAHASRRFLELFRRSQRFSEVNAGAEKMRASPLVGLFQAGYLEIDGQVKAARAGGAESAYKIQSLEGLERSLRRASGIELTLLSRGASFLATTASASPFIGLFGTVWGIMITFQDIGATGSTSLVAVAPGISEALVNTALGLVAAIPALMGYNHFSNRLRNIRSEMEDFILEFLNMAERNFT